MGDRLFKPQDAHKLEDPERQGWLPVADVIRALAIRPGMHVADVGAGTGYFAIPMAQAVGPNGKPDAPRNIDLAQGEAGKTTLGSKCADVVLIANVWHELDDHEAALQEAARILDGGKKSYEGGPSRNNVRSSSGCVTIWAAGTRNQGWN